MMREEAKGALGRWSEIIAGIVLLLLSLWWLFHSWGYSKLLGWVGIALGAAIVYAGVQRLRFHSSGQGLGSLRIDERRLGYFGPLTGGVIDLDELVSLSFDGTGKPAHWILADRAGNVLAIPENSEGADALYDAFAALPGLQMSAVIEARRKHKREKQILWRAVSSAPR